MPAINRSLLFYLLIGLVQAGLMLAVKDHAQPGMVAGVTAAVLVVGINAQLLGTYVRRGVWLWVAALAILFAAVSTSVFMDSANDMFGDSWLRTCWVLSAVAAGYIATAFITAWSPGDRPRYEALFQRAWNNVFIVLLALLLCALFWLLIWLCGSLFNMLGIHVFKRVFLTTEFIYISIAVVFSLGMRMGVENEKVIAMLRGVLLTVCRFLIPMSVLIVVFFIATLPFTGLAPIWKTGHSTLILLLLVGVSIFLINGVFQDGRQSTAYPAWLVQCVNVSLLCLPVLAVLAGYSSWLRIEQYGLTPSRFIAMVLVLLAGLHSLATVYAVLGRQTVWLGSLRTSNPLLALVTFAVLVAVHTVWFNPLAFSARDQVQRLLDGRTSVAKFDSKYLRYHLGRAGRQSFDALLVKAESEKLFDEEARSLLLFNLRAIKDDKAFRAQPLSKNFIWIGPKVDGSEQFGSPDIDATSCPDSACMLWAVDLNGDGQSEVLQIPTREAWRPIDFFTRTPEGKWVKAGTIEGPHSSTQVIDSIRAGKVSVVKPLYQNLDIGGVVLVPKPIVKAEKTVTR